MAIARALAAKPAILLADKGFRANRTRNLIAVLAIALTTLLFSSLFTIALGTIENFQRETMRQSGGDSHGTIKDVSWEQYEKLKTHPFVKESAPCILVADVIRKPEFLKRHVEAWYYPTYHYKHCFVEIIDGEAPKKANEILLDETSLKLLGKEPKAGQTVTLQMQIRQNQKKLDQVITDSGYSIMEGNSHYIASNANWAYVSDGAEGDPLTIGAVIGALLLILLAGKMLVPSFMALSSYEGDHAGVSLNPYIFLGAAALSILTIFISIRKPAKMASRISQVEAVRYTEGVEYAGRKRKGKANSKRARTVVKYTGWPFPICPEIRKRRWW